VKLKSVKLTIADTIADTIVLIGSTIKINASPFDLNYKWTATTNFNQISPSSIESKIDKTSTYYVVVENENCSTKDSISISPYDWLCEFPYVFVPNAFSPNNDNQNDVLYVKGRPISSILLRIYDRWGELVFESTSLNDGWDGTYKEKALPPDVYDYYLLVTCINGVKNKIQGNITLLR
jgi:gliding motility-associated-like protein